MSHRRKLLAFLFILPLLLMILFGALLGGQTVPPVPNSTIPAIQNLQKDKNLAALFSILKARESGGSAQFKVLVASVPGTNNASQQTLYVIPDPNNTTVILIDSGASSYRSIAFNNNGTIINAAFGPQPIPSSSNFQTLPQVNLQTLYTDKTATKLAQAALGIFGLGLNIELGPQQRLLDILFPEIVGLEIGWVGVLGAAVTSVEDRLSGARRRILMTPISRLSFILGSAMGNFLLIGLQLIVLFATGILVFKVNVAGSLLDLIPVIAAASFSVIGIGLTISHFSRTPDEAFYFSALVNLPSGFLASQYIPIVHTTLSTLVSSIFPMTYANKALTAIILDGASLIAVLPQLVSLGIFALALYVAGTVMIMRER